MMQAAGKRKHLPKRHFESQSLETKIISIEISLKVSCFHLAPIHDLRSRSKVKQRFLSFKTSRNSDTPNIVYFISNPKFRVIKCTGILDVFRKV